MFSGRSSCLGLQRQKRTYSKKGREFHKSQVPESGLIWRRSKALLYGRKGRSWYRATQRDEHIPHPATPLPRKTQRADVPRAAIQHVSNKLQQHWACQSVWQDARLSAYQSIWLTELPLLQIALRGDKTSTDNFVKDTVTRDYTIINMQRYLDPKYTVENTLQNKYEKVRNESGSKPALRKKTNTSNHDVK